MADSLKDALIKAGVVSKDKIEREKEQERREKIQSKGPSQHGIHAHHLRTDCALCNRTSPDVEYYEHNDRRISAKWLCLECADKSWIPDETRQTHQSQHAKSGMFRRQFGPTKKFPPPGAAQAQGAGRPGAGAPGGQASRGGAPGQPPRGGSPQGGNFKPQGGQPGTPGGAGKTLSTKPASGGGQGQQSESGQAGQARQTGAGQQGHGGQQRPGQPGAKPANDNPDRFKPGYRPPGAFGNKPGFRKK